MKTILLGNPVNTSQQAAIVLCHSFRFAEGNDHGDPEALPDLDKADAQIRRSGLSFIAGPEGHLFPTQGKGSADGEADLRRAERWLQEQTDSCCDDEVFQVHVLPSFLT